ncbi:MAG: hypothetical protein V4719_05900 [Planctomycetota bacterium]
MRHTGWLCASLAAATGLYSFCGSHSAADAAGVPPSTARDDASADDELSARVSVNEVPDSAEDESIQRALFEADASQDPAIRRVGLWSSKKPAATAAAKKPTPLSKLWRSKPDSVTDPFAEADAAAQAKVVAGDEPTITAGGEGSGFAKSSSNRRRLLEYQTESKGAVAPSVAGKSTSNTATVAKPIASTTPRATVAKAPVAAASSDAEERALFENDAAAPTASRVALTPAAKLNEAARAERSSKDEIRQVSEADFGQTATAVPASELSSDETPLPTEALKYRAQLGLQRTQGEVAADQGEIATAVPDLTSRRTARGLPSPQPKLERDLFETAEPEGATAPQDLASTQPEPAMIRASETEPRIRPATKPPLPALQVVANRPMELPVPEGWSAAVKLNARRAARMAELLGHQPVEKATEVRPTESRASAPRRTIEVDPVAYRVERQSPHQPVALGQIEEEGAVRVMSADDSLVADIRDALHTESEGAAIEPAKISESSSEPIVVPEYAAHGQTTTWMLYLITAGSVLFGFYGMWSCWFRSSDSN